jgi:hypothetical protein
MIGAVFRPARNLTNCVLSANSSGGAGGGTWEATLVGCTLSNNSAWYGGGSSAGMLIQAARDTSRSIPRPRLTG